MKKKTFTDLVNEIEAIKNRFVEIRDKLKAEKLSANKTRTKDYERKTD